jgi:probable phosphoglycerate mutase
MTRLYLVRHAEASGNIEKKFHGHFDSDLTKNGYAQLEYLSKRFIDIDIDVCYSSDLQRAKKLPLP